MASQTSQKVSLQRLWELSRFSLRSLIAAAAVVALFIVIAIPIYHWYTSIPLSLAVDRFNAQTEDTNPSYGQPLTEDEIVKAIEAQLPSLQANTKVLSALSRIARTRRLPSNASLDAFRISARAPNGSRSVKQWAINLDIMIDASSGFSIRIREAPPLSE